MNYIDRKEYIDFLYRHKDKKIIKVVSGIRRCGKSTLFEIYKDKLIKDGIDPTQIISINFEDLDYEELKDYKKLYKFIIDKLTTKKNYIFLDEIQHCFQFERCVDSLFIKDNVDVYITGSNAYFMSSELATLLSGRYVELKMLPLSFKEYCSVKSNDLNLEYNNYLLYSSFPYTINSSIEETQEYLRGIYSSILLNDIIARYKITDVMLLEDVIKYIFENIGNLTSAKKISDTLGSYGRKIDNKTVEKYLNALSSSLIIYKVYRYNIKGKQVLKSHNKYYVSDLGLRYLLLGRKNQDRGRMLENVVYLELIRRGYDVYVVDNDNTEVDFLVSNFYETVYIQVSESLQDTSTFEREIKSLQLIKDNYSKIILILDSDTDYDYNGIKIMNVLEWLLDK